MGQIELDNLLVPLKGLNFEDLISRPLGNRYVKNNIAKVMDAVILNRAMRRPILDKELFKKNYPENKHIKAEADE